MMFNRKSCVIGNFGYKTNQLDGQTVKTRFFYKSLSEYTDCGYIDIGYGFIRSFLPLLLLPFFYKNIFFLPGIRILKIYSPFLIFCKLFFGINIHYIVIGGWINSLCKSNIYVKYLLCKFDSVSCELKSMVKDLRIMNINSIYFPNFRDKANVSNIKENEGVRLFFLSRIIKEKGIFEAINLTNKINELEPNISCTLDIYGPNLLTGNDLFLFENSCNNVVSYKGPLSPSDIHYTINQYDFLVFPTTYRGEGFPGCIVDAKIAGASVICSDWKYNSEIIDNEIDGLVIDINDFVNVSALKVIKLFKSGDINNLKISSLKSSNSYLKEIVFPTWLNDINFK